MSVAFDVLTAFRDSVVRFTQDRGAGPAPGMADTERYSNEAIRGLWREMATMGWLAAPLAEEFGGLGLPDATLIVMRELGANLLASPFASAVAAANALLAGSSAVALLTAVADGTLRIALADRERSRSVATARQKGDGFSLDADKTHILDAGIATHFCVPALIKDGELALFLVPANADGLAGSVRKTPHGTPVGSIRFEALDLPRAALIAVGKEAEERLTAMRDSITAAACAEAVGLMRSMLEMTVAYAKERKQFGAALSSFQALRHRMADMYAEVEAGESAATLACNMIGTTGAVADAKLRIDAALRIVVHEAIQIHGGIGTTAELGLSGYVHRALAINFEYCLPAASARGGGPDRRCALASDDVSSAAHSAQSLDTAEDDTFRTEVRDFLSSVLTDRIRQKSQRQTGVFAEPELAAQWHRILFEKGWIAPSWPVEHGGTGWSLRQRRIFEQEGAKLGTPLLPAMGLQMCGPVLMRFGTDEQKRFFLPRILSGEHRWCQGYSEPGSGSDLASLSTRMVRDGDSYVINGTKIWTTFAHAADWIFMLVRTNPLVKPQQGISFVLVPMDSPGITVAPIRSISGDHEVNQVFFDNVRVPVGNLVGAENEGWAVAKYLLEFERGGGWVSARATRVMDSLRQVLTCREPLDHALVNRIEAIEREIAVAEWTQTRMFDDVTGLGSIGNTGASILKLNATGLYQEACLLHLDVVADGNAFDEDRLRAGPGWSGHEELHRFSLARYLNSRAMSIFGGTTEIQKTILAREALGI